MPRGCCLNLRNKYPRKQRVALSSERLAGGEAPWPQRRLPAQGRPHPGAARKTQARGWAVATATSKCHCICVTSRFGCGWGGSAPAGPSVKAGKVRGPRAGHGGSAGLLSGTRLRSWGSRPVCESMLAATKRSHTQGSRTRHSLSPGSWGPKPETEARAGQVPPRPPSSCVDGRAPLGPHGVVSPSVSGPDPLFL